MAANKGDISHWFDRGVEQGATHMIIVCDDFDYDDYPVYVQPDQDVREIADSNNVPDERRVMEVYCLSMDKATQLAEGTALHYETAV